MNGLLISIFNLSLMTTYCDRMYRAHAVTTLAKNETELDIISLSVAVYRLYVQVKMLNRHLMMSLVTELYCV